MSVSKPLYEAVGTHGKALPIRIVKPDRNKTDIERSVEIGMMRHLMRRYRTEAEQAVNEIAREHKILVDNGAVIN